MSETPTPRTEPSATEKLCQWLRDNSSGDYRKCADAAGLIERQEMAIQHLARVAGEALEESNRILKSEGYSRFSDIRMQIADALSEIQRIKNQTK